MSEGFDFEAEDNIEEKDVRARIVLLLGEQGLNGSFVDVLASRILALHTEEDLMNMSDEEILSLVKN